MKFKCELCRNSVLSPVSLECGHVFCWRCLCKHLETNAMCPKCGTIINRDKIVPIYGCGKDDPNLDELPPMPELHKTTQNENRNENQGRAPIDEQEVLQGPFGGAFNNRNVHVQQFTFGFGPMFGFHVINFGGRQNGQQQRYPPIVSLLLSIIPILFMFFIMFAFNGFIIL